MRCRAAGSTTAKVASVPAVVPTANVDYTITWTNVGDATANVTTIGGEPGTIWYYDFRCSAN